MGVPRGNRRQLIQGTGGLVVGFGLGSASPEPGVVPAPVNQTEQDVQTRNVSGDVVDSWLAIDEAGAVTLYVGKVELGTGIQTALAQIAAEELDVPFERVSVVQGDTSLTPDQGYTAGSKSLQVAGPVVRQAAARARSILIHRAAKHLGAAVEELAVGDGVVRIAHDPGASVPYGELAGEPFAEPVTGDAPLKAPADYTIVGRSLPRLDLPVKLTGAPAYVQDVAIAGMLHGRVVRPYVRTMDGVGATILAVDDGAAMQMPGVVQVVRDGDFVGVVAAREEQAIAASRALKVTWSEPAMLSDDAAFFDEMKSLVVEDRELANAGDVAGALGTAAKTLDAWYRFPAQAHAPIAPSCAVADVRADGATIYSHTQGVYQLRNAVAPLLGLAPERVRVIYREGAGCYGHDGAEDVAADAALLSKAVGKPVRVQWMREDEFAWEPKAPPMLSHVRGGLDAAGNIVAWDYEVWTPTHTTRPGGNPAGLLAGQLIDPPAGTIVPRNGGGDRNAPHTYAFPNNRVTVHWVGSAPLRPSALRSLGGTANTTANESFVDEMAAAAGADPIAFRLRHLTDPRAIDVVTKAAAVSGWQARPSGPIAPGSTPPAGLLTGRGIAFVRYETQYAYVAVVAEVAVDSTRGDVRVTKVTVAHDCGLVVNPDGLTNQIEGNVVQGISRALKEEVTHDRHAVTSLDWSSYPILTFPEVPAIEIALIDRPDEPAWGAGEVALCPTIAAVNNAIFDATGVRLRTVPYTAERVRAALR
ncbi:MAG TPA: molybdopterin cofactor-binding domain-containing protein [Thermomicrobiales bacterium]|jgi:CO/xanthine dehydrogenase Mo-binding subunit